MRGRGPVSDVVSGHGYGRAKGGLLPPSLLGDRMTLDKKRLDPMTITNLEGNLTDRQQHELKTLAKAICVLLQEFGRVSGSFRLRVGSV
jgi:hypothetical protein